MKKIICNFFVIMCIMCIVNNVFGVSYLYKKDNDEVQSSISTKDVIATPEFNFTSRAQILIEPYSKTVLYENNADEHLLPASVTKVMTF